MASHWIPRAATPTAAGESWGMVLFGDTQIESHFFDFLAAQYPLHPIRYIASWSAAYPNI